MAWRYANDAQRVGDDGFVPLFCALVGPMGALLLCMQVPPAFGEPCGRGVLTPPCNAATYVDMHIFTVAHM